MSDNSHSILLAPQRRPLKPASPLLLFSHPYIRSISKSCESCLISLCWNPSHGHTHSLQTGLPASALQSLWSIANTMARGVLELECQESCCSAQSLLMASHFTQKKRQMPSTVYKVLSGLQAPPPPQYLSSCSLPSSLPTASLIFLEPSRHASISGLYSESPSPRYSHLFQSLP